jgi:hypothetical protein
MWNGNFNFLACCCMENNSTSLSSIINTLIWPHVCHPWKALGAMEDGLCMNVELGNIN